MPIDPADYRVVGGSRIYRPPAAPVAAGGLLTSRFQVVGGTQQLASTELATILWPIADIDWDDIGFLDDYSTNGSFLLSTEQNCELQISCYVKGEDAGGGASTGFALLDIETNSGDPPDLVPEMSRIPIEPGNGIVDLITTGGHRFYASLPGEFRVQLWTFDVDNGPLTITQASLYIVRVRTIPPL